MALATPVAGIMGPSSDFILDGKAARSAISSARWARVNAARAERARARRRAKSPVWAVVFSLLERSSGTIKIQGRENPDPRSKTAPPAYFPETLPGALSSSAGQGQDNPDPRSKTAPPAYFPETLPGALSSSAGATVTTASPAMVRNWVYDGKWSGPLRGVRGGCKGNRKEQTIRQKLKRQLAHKLAKEAGASRRPGRPSGSHSKEQEQKAKWSRRRLCGKQTPLGVTAIAKQSHRRPLARFRQQEADRQA